MTGVAEERLRAVVQTLRDEVQGRDREPEIFAEEVTAAMRDAADLIEQLRSEASRVPEGWKVVPVEPTSEMYGAGGVEQFKCDLADAPVRDTVGRVYAAMVAAAPASPDTQTQENDRG